MSSKWSYVAGIFDGEGTASIASYTRTSVDGRGKGPYTYVQHEAKVCIKSTSIPLMKWLVGNFGGVFYQQDNSKYGWKTSYSWQVKGHKNKENFLLGVLPYLIIKKEQALLVLEYLRMDGVSNPEKRKELAARCKQLNQVGTSVETNTLDPLNLITGENIRVTVTNLGVKIESELHGDVQSEPDVNQAS